MFQFVKIIIYQILEISCKYQRKSHIFSHKIANFLSNFIGSHQYDRKLAA